MVVHASKTLLSKKHVSQLWGQGVGRKAGDTVERVLGYTAKMCGKHGQIALVIKNINVNTCLINYDSVVQEGGSL